MGVDVAEEGFDAFYRANFHRLAAQLHAYLGDFAEAQDVVQEAFTRAWPRWAMISGYDDPAAWVRRVAWNLATSRWRKVWTATTFAARHRPDGVPALSAEWVDITRALAALPPNHRRAIVLHYLGGVPVAEIAAESGVADNTVKSWLLRGRAALADRLSVTGEATRGRE